MKCLVKKKIVAGENIRKTENNDEIIIHGSAEGVGGGGAVGCDCPFEVRFERNEGAEASYTCIMGHGRVNNTTTDEAELHDKLVARNDADEAQFTILEVTFV